MSSIIARFTRTDGESRTAIGNLFLNRRTSPSQPMHTTQWPCFALVTQGAKSLTLGDHVFDYGVGDCLVVSVDVPVISRVTKATPRCPHLGLGMAIDGVLLKELLKRVDVPVVAGGGGSCSVAVNKASSELLDAMLRLVRLLERPDEIPAIAPLIEQEILYRLLQGPHGPFLLRIAAIDSPCNKIAKAVAWLRQYFALQLRVEELATYVGMSVSSLHHHFSAVTAMTPLQFQKQLRLHEARRLMLVERLDVGSAGYRVGYQSPSQFSREYRRLYGLSPRRDLDRARATVHGAVVV
ncbi:AraC family transcriptional regulator [Cupriavidus campinensis]|uniref:AraC family transcriptional regulator n=1 Tax=Cupriavidus campinensis TaxID=151783 RepID=UPI0011EEF7FB|nr:AraC family transcriptional regulator [Cupriavidus campinensis]